MMLCQLLKCWKLTLLLLNLHLSTSSSVHVSSYIKVSYLGLIFPCITSVVQFSRSVVSNSLQPHGLQHARPPFPSPTPEFTQTQIHWVGDNHPTISSSVLFSHLQSFPTLGSFPMSQFFASGGQSIKSFSLLSKFPVSLIYWIVNIGILIRTFDCKRENSSFFFT